MTHPTSTNAMSLDAAEPKATRGAVPVWLFFLAFVLLFAAVYYFDNRSGWFKPQIYTPYYSVLDLERHQPPTGGPDLGRGRAVYENVCALCHNSDGNGKPNQAPPLAGSDWVTGSTSRLIRIPLAGLTGPIEVKSEKWNLAMPAMGAALSDEDLAAVLTYMRASWGNKASEITAEQVKAVRTKLGGRSQPFTGPELLGIQEP